MKLKLNELVAMYLSTTIFVLLPFLFSTKLQDVEISLRFVGLSGILFISSVLLIINIVRTKSALPWNQIFIPLAGYLVITFIGVFRSINFGDGLFEFMKLLLFGILFFHLYMLLSNSEKNKLLFFKSICLSSIIFMSFGIWQLVTSKSYQNNFIIDFSLSSSLGNKNSFAEVLLLMFPFCIGTAFLCSNLWRVIGIFSSAGILLSLFMLQTLSTWIAFSISIFIIVIVLFKINKKLLPDFSQRKKLLFSIVFVCIISSGVAFYYLLNNNNSAFQSKVAAIKTLIFSDGTDALEQKPNSIYERSFLWSKTLAMINDYPIFGCGMANWKILLPSYGLGSAAYMKNDSVRFVHPHNDFLLIAAETGIPSLLLFAAFLIILLKYAFYQFYHSKIRENQIQSILMIFGLFSLIIISFFGMPLSRIYPAIILMVIAAIIVSEQTRITGSENKFSSRTPLILLLLFALSTAGIAIFGNKRLNAEFLLSDALMAEKNRDYLNMNAYLQQINTSVLPVDVTATPVSWYQGYCWFYLGNIDAAFNAFKEAEKNNPYHLKLLNDLGTCYNLKGDSNAAKNYYLKALKIQPSFNNALINLAVIYFNQGALESAFQTVVKVSGAIEKESVPNVSAILLAKFKTITSDEVILAKIKKTTSSQFTLVVFLTKLKSYNFDLQLVINNL